MHLPAKIYDIPYFFSVRNLFCFPVQHVISVALHVVEQITIYFASVYSVMECVTKIFSVQEIIVRILIS
jgi:hypothetical protein